MNLNMNTELINVEKAFSTLCKEKGINNAFLYYVAEEGVMLRTNSMPVIGKNKIKQLFQNDDSNIEFTWKPLYTEVAKSGDLGYTYGIYEINTGKSEQKGIYVSIWKKNTTG